MLSLPATVKWRRQQVEDTKREIKAELDRASDPHDPKKRLSVALKRIGEFREDPTPTGQLKLYVYVMSALVQHERFGGLDDRKIHNLAKIALAILKTNGINPEQSKLAFLYGELHLLLSQVYRREGDHWLSAWQQQIGEHVSRRDPPGGQALQALSKGLRAQRLGQGHLALKHFQDAESAGGSHDLTMKARLGRLKTLRLTGQRDAARDLVRATEGVAQLTPAERRELAWEGACLAIPETGKIGELVVMTQAGCSHHLAEYLLEAVLWAYAVRDDLTGDRLISVRYMARKSSLKPQRFGVFYDLALAIESLYDAEVPFAFRLQNLGEALRHAPELLTIDKELLVWAAAARWLARNQAHDLATYTLGRYRALNLLLTDGESEDTLGLARDLFAKDWFRDRRQTA